MGACNIWAIVRLSKLKGEIEDFKTKNKSLESSNNYFKEANNEVSKTNPLMFKDLKKFQAELDKYNDLNYASKIKLYKTREDKELDKVIALENKVKEMVADLRYFNSLEHEVDTLKSQLETQKTQFLNEIDRLSREYYYADHMNAILGVYTDLDEFTNLQCDYVETWEKCEHLEKELSKSRTMSKSFEALQKHAINLELDLQQCKEKIKNDKSFKENQSNVFLKEREQYFEIQDLKAQLQDKGIAISELKKLIEKMKGKSVETKFEKSSVIRQPNAFKSQRQSILGKPAIFSDSLAKKDFSKSKPVTTQNVSNDFSKPVTAQILPQNMLPIVKNTNVIAPGMYKVHTKPNQTRTPQLHQDIRKPNKRVSFSTGVIPNTSVSRPQLKSNHLEDRVMSNNSQGKKQEVEDHRRKFKFSNNKTSVTACNDSLNAKTSNVNFVSKETSSQAWLWHCRLSHLNFDTINLLSKNNIVNALRLKFVEDHLCSSCELGKAKRKSFHTKTTSSSKRQLQFLHMDLCGPMRVESINGKKYVLIIGESLLRYTWTHFLRSKDETPVVLIDFLTLVQRGLYAQVRTVQTDKGTEFLNKTLYAKYKNRSLIVEAAEQCKETAKVPLVLLVIAIATTWFYTEPVLSIATVDKAMWGVGFRIVKGLDGCGEVNEVDIDRMWGLEVWREMCGRDVQ
ncbi:retrovirus-related pol polyprotein from transposon TNT 1-94 [Tanacetum coccineum]